MRTTIFLATLLLSGAASANDGAAREIYVPIERSLWRVASDGSAKVQSFQFEGGTLGSGTEAKLSADRRLIAFGHAGNLWTFEPITGRCIQISGYGECDPGASGCHGITLYGWTPDSRNLVFSSAYADYGPGEGEPPPKFEALKGCRSTSTVMGFELPNAEDNEESSSAAFLIDIKTSHLQRLKSDEKPAALVYSDGAYDGVAKSPDGKIQALIRDPYQGKSELVVGGKVALPGIKVRRFWWITNDALAALSYSNDQKNLELRIVHVPDLKVSGNYTQPRQ